MAARASDYQPFPIADLRQGLELHREPWLSHPAAWHVLENAYVYLGRLHKRPGYEVFGELSRSTTENPGTGSGEGTSSSPWNFTAANLPLIPGTIVIEDSGTHTGANAVTDDGAGTLTHPVDGFLGFVDYATGQMSVALLSVAFDSNVTVQYGYRKLTVSGAADTTNMVMGILPYYGSGGAAEEQIAFDRTDAFRYNSSSEVYDQITVNSLWLGEPENYKLGVNWDAKLIVSNDVDPIAYWDGTNWKEMHTDWLNPTYDPPDLERSLGGGDTDPWNPSPAITYSRQVERCRIMVRYRNRMVLLGTRENGVEYPRRARWSKVSPTFDKVPTIPVTGEAPGTGNSEGTGANPYNETVGSASTRPIEEGTLVIEDSGTHAGANAVTDDGAGNLTHTVDGTVGTVDYDTGAITVNGLSVAFDSNVTFDYSHRNVTGYDWDPNDWSDAATEDTIRSARFLGGVLYVAFERSIWKLLWKDDFRQPFEWVEVSKFDGGSPKMGSIGFSREVHFQSRVRLVGCDGTNSYGVDKTIPDFALGWELDKLEQTFGILLKEHRQSWLSYVQPGQDYPTKQLVYQYEDQAFSVFMLPFQAMGTYQSEQVLLWDDVEEPWDDLFYSFDTRFGSSGYPLVLGGTRDVRIMSFGGSASDDGAAIPFRARSQRLNPFAREGSFQRARLGFVDVFGEVGAEVSLKVSFFKDFESGAWKQKEINLRPTSGVKRIARILVNATARWHTIELSEESGVPLVIDAVVPWMKPVGSMRPTELAA